MKKYIALAVVIVFLFSGCGEVSPKLENGWQSREGNTYYLVEGVLLTGLQSVDGVTYYFDPDRDGAMVTGWLELPRGWYYFDSTGAMQTGWVEISGKQYYFCPDGDMAVGTVLIDGKYQHFTSAGEPFLLVNRNYSLPEDYEPDLVEIDGHQVARECVDALTEMMEDCRSTENKCVINSAYRDVAEQQAIWDTRYKNYLDKGYSTKAAEELVAQGVLPPGSSEHHTGLAIDLGSTTEGYAWLAEHAPEYGFILRYPEDKIHWTGIMYERWHFRYVGRELALELQTNNLTVEEYLYQLTPIP